MVKLTVYQKPTCTTCRQVLKLIEASGHPYQAINYYETPLTKTKLKQLLKKAGLTARDVLRTKEDVYKRFKDRIATMTEEQLIDFILEHPDLLQRPLVEKGNTAILARPAEAVKRLLNA
ncbi:MAG: arsenate reductase [Nitrospirae bacterium]|nr:MAG: arsenate reductase [Nitrospirota bacterium]